MKTILLLAVLVSCLTCGLGARILAMLPFIGKSHHIFTSAVLKTLVQRGHQVVEYGPQSSLQESDNYTHIEIHTSSENVLNTITYENITKNAQKRNYCLGLSFLFVWLFTYDVCEETFQHDRVKALLKSNEHFDLVITESSFGQEAMVVFGHKFGAPTITLQSFASIAVINMDAGNSLSIATIPDMTIVASEDMSLVERVMNFLSVIMTLSTYYLYQIPSHDRLIKKYYAQERPPLEAMMNNISLYLVNSHPAIEYVRSYTPNMIPIGGITLSPDRSILPKNIQTFMDNAKEGVIYFSFGTVVPSHIMPKEVLQTYVNVFKKLKQKVLWKIKLDKIQNLPDNVMLTKWVPQPGVLAHPNCVLFITHGGFLSQQDAINAGVPTIAIPFFADQPSNAKLSEYRGFGESLDFETLTEETLEKTLAMVLSNPKYRVNAKRLSKIFRDWPTSPSESIVFWVEYVMRHGGAHHLRPAAAQLSWYQLTLLDILAAIIVAILLVLLAVYVVLRKILSYLFKKDSSKQSNEKKKKTKSKKNN